MSLFEGELDCTVRIVLRQDGTREEMVALLDAAKEAVFRKLDFLKVEEDWGGKAILEIEADQSLRPIPAGHLRSIQRWLEFRS